MGRKANKGDELVEFIPKADGNAEDQDPVVLVFRRPTERERRNLYFSAPKDAADVKALIRFQDELLELVLVEVKNWDGIASSSEFLEYAETEFYTEAADFAGSLLGLSEDEVKNSKGSSGSTGRTTRAKVGTTTPAQKRGASEVAA